MQRPRAGWKTWLTRACALAMLSGCEVVVDFEREKLEDQTTIGPTPLPNSDGSVALIPDAARADGALIGPEDEEDAATLDGGASDAALADADGAAAPSDAAGIDAAQPPEVDANLDDASGAIGAGE